MKPLIDPTAGELVVSWEQYHALIEYLALLIHDRGCPFDQVVALSRGGLRVGDVISRLFSRPLVVMAVSSYGGADGREQGSVRVGQSLAHTCPRLGSHLLLVDDLADQGTTLEAATTWLRRAVKPDSLTTAVLWLKRHSALRPHIWAMELPASPWILQPFERYEKLTPADLLQKTARGAA
ncbi:MAG: phosphoribosyltransferase family protein [Cyanobacteria bacterium MAG CAR3_bin_5]|nr:phosphoribosyltransferase family protein [Cyanobacteria bacterium MAG CAR3_bin_5]